MISLLTTLLQVTLCGLCHHPSLKKNSHTYRRPEFRFHKGDRPVEPGKDLHCKAKKRRPPLFSILVFFIKLSDGWANLHLYFLFVGPHKPDIFFIPLVYPWSKFFQCRKNVYYLLQEGTTLILVFGAGFQPDSAFSTEQVSLFIRNSTFRAFQFHGVIQTFQGDIAALFLSPERINKENHHTGKNKCPGQFAFPFICLNPYCESKDQTQDNPFDVFFHRIFPVSSQRNKPFSEFHWTLFCIANFLMNQQ